MANGTFSMDKHIPDVLVFPRGTDLHDNGLYKEGKIILQDKVSGQKIFSSRQALLISPVVCRMKASTLILADHLMLTFPGKLFSSFHSNSATRK
jgi:hypothetical protein